MTDFKSEKTDEPVITQSKEGENDGRPYTVETRVFPDAGHSGDLLNWPDYVWWWLNG